MVVVGKIGIFLGFSQAQCGKRGCDLDVGLREYFGVETKILGLFDLLYTGCPRIRPIKLEGLQRGPRQTF